jgi:hypothetical protein
MVLCQVQNTRIIGWLKTSCQINAEHVCLFAVPFLLTRNCLYPILFRQNRVPIKGPNKRALPHFKGSSMKFFNLIRENKFPDSQ